jgi:hypothetical protein
MATTKARHQSFASHIDQRAYSRFTALYISALVFMRDSRDCSSLVAGDRNINKVKVLSKAIGC